MTASPAPDRAAPAEDDTPGVAPVGEGAQPDLAFPAGFVWGAATSAYQIEGGIDEDGRGRSVWDDFVDRPGVIEDGSTGSIAADHRHLFRRDVELMDWLGLDAYRFSVSWPRVQPDGRGAVSATGLGFYDELVDELLSRAIEPMVTLFHWDLPSTLQSEGGWAARETAQRFAEYAGIVYDKLGDRVQRWLTINEPRTHALLGYASGLHAPGVQDYQQACAAVHHLLLGHGLATEVLRGGAGEPLVGFAPDPAPVVAQGDRPQDLEVARRVDGLVNRLYLDPVLLGKYPQDVREDLRAWLTEDTVQDGDERIIGAPLDFLGVNYYRPYWVVAGERPPAGTPSIWPGVEEVEFVRVGGPLTDNGWDIQAEGLTQLLLMIHTEYPRVPLYITENGAAYNDGPVDGAVDDQRRIDYLANHLRAAHQAIQQGVDLRGYMVWSLLDNFEWERGYGMRFGLIHVDYDTLERLPKASAHWYRDLIQANGLSG